MATGLNVWNDDGSSKFDVSSRITRLVVCLRACVLTRATSSSMDFPGFDRSWYRWVVGPSLPPVFKAAAPPTVAMASRW